MFCDFVLLQPTADCFDSSDRMGEYQPASRHAAHSQRNLFGLSRSRWRLNCTGTLLEQLYHGLLKHLESSTCSTS
ncbi:hypothetical protein CBM2599_B50305 [Cupriavidus taiwanensis]|nr:hypothetical protein CBM2600_B10687 [Cupriavidus taiwanensis]SOY96373.1 hypothetical protein CBM2599_B50305 [Cupriavidus taiwanensis]